MLENFTWRKVAVLLAGLAVASCLMAWGIIIAEAKALQRPLSDDALKIVMRGGRQGRQGSRMKFVTARPFADPEAAARKLVEIANTVEPVQDGRIP